MKYEYEPVLLENWIRDNRNKFVTPDVVNANERYEATLDKLKKEFLSITEANEANITQWFEGLKRREKLLVPNLYREDLNVSVKQHLKKFILENAKQDKRMFRVMVDVVYQTGNLDDLWNILKYSYAVHKDKIERRLEKEQAKKWTEFLLSTDPVNYLGKTAYEGEKGFLEELETFYLTENSPLFKLVLLDVFGFAGEDFFIEEKNLFKSYFKKATNFEQQDMASKLIRQCNLNHVMDLGQLVFERLKTYRRKPMLWNHVGDSEKKRFQKWILQMELKDFFSQVNQSHERFVYWKKFIHRLEDAVVTDNKETLIMYFDDVVIMEVLSVGAVYVYDLPTFQRHFQYRIDEMLQEREEMENRSYFSGYKEVKRASLMNKSLIYKNGWLTHRGGWQAVFDSWLNRQLRWEVNERVLQAEAEGMAKESNSYRKGD